MTRVIQEGAPAKLDEILITEELTRRPARPPDFEAESRALVVLATAMTESPQDVLQMLAERALGLCQAGSAGISLLASEDAAVFTWRATAGLYAHYVGATLPRDFSPCGVVLDRGQSLLMADPVRQFPYIDKLCAPVREVLLVPFHRANLAVGTVWVVAHDADRKFDAEDARILASLSKFAGAAVLTLERMQAAETAERVQSEREQHLRALINATSDVVYSVGADWKVMQPLDGRGLVASNVDADPDWMEQHIPSFERARVEHAIAKAIAQKTAFELEHQVIGPDGQPGWTFSRAIPVLDADGEIKEWFGAASDITRRKLAEEGLRDIYARMEAALSAGTIGTFSWDVQSDRFFGDMSLSRIVGVNASALSGGSLAGVVAAVQADDRVGAAQLLARLLDVGGRYEYDFRVADPAGGWRWVTARGQTEQDAQGRTTRVSGVVIDVTERKHAEAALTSVTVESERRKRLYETALSNTPDLTYVFDLEHRFTFANQALLTLWGKTWEEAIGKTCLELGYEAWHAAKHDREIEEVRATQRPIRGEVPFAGFNGAPSRIYDYIFVPVFGASGDVEAVAGTTRDVTDRQTMEQELRKADRQKDDFIAVLAHELRNPLAPIATGLGLLREGAEPARQAHTLGVMGRQVEHMVRLIDDLLDVSRITRGKLTLRREHVRVAQIIEAALEASHQNIARGGHTLHTSFCDEELILDADQTRIAQVISNLLDNASKYTPDGGTIALRTRRDGNELSIQVTDTGLGIPKDQLEHVFTMFSQVNRALERSQGGLGIGLSLVRTLVTLHDGRVSVESEGPGCGSTFTIHLPLQQPLPPQPAPREQEAPSLAQGTRILVVDDNEDAAELLKFALESGGFEASTAHDGPSAIATAERVRPRVIFLDIGMPGMSGYEVAEQLRSDVRFADTVLIALTGWGTQEDQRKAIAAGFDLHLTKPVSTKELRKALSRAATLRP